MEEDKKSNYWKFVVIFLTIVALGTAVFVGLRIRERSAGEDAVQKAAEALKKAEEESYRLALADTYGGKTPQETLRMYIDAVEKGDYVLASKYFIGDYQERELKKLQNSPKENTSNVVGLLKVDLKSDGGFSADKHEYLISKPLVVDFRLYPNGIWKIIEI